MDENGTLILKKRRKADVWIVLIILGIAAGLYFSGLFGGGDAGSVAVVSVDGAEYARLPLDKDTEIVVATERGRNVVKVKDGAVFMSDADCPDRLCVKQHAIKNSGETIVCLPNKVVVEVSGGRKSDLDAVAGRR